MAEMVTGLLWPHEIWTNYFASGSNYAGEIRGFGWNGRSVGCSVNALKPEGIEALIEVAELGALVFVDSGAFGEVDRKLNVIKPITHEEWLERLAMYDELSCIGSRLWVVAPDRVGCQTTTLERLERYAPRMAELRAKGVHVIVPLQKGAMTAYEFDCACREALGCSDFVRGIPSAKGVITTEELSDLADALWDDPTVPKPVRVHLLGMAPNRTKAYREFANTLMLRLAGTWPMPPPGETTPTLTCDSCRIIALSGKTNGPGGGPRAITKWRAAVLEQAVSRNEELDTDEIKHRTLDRVCREEHTRLMAESAVLGFEQEVETND